MLNFCDFIQACVFTTNHHLNWLEKLNTDKMLRNAAEAEGKVWIQ